MCVREVWESGHRGSTQRPEQGQELVGTWVSDLERPLTGTPKQGTWPPQPCARAGPRTS